MDVPYVDDGTPDAMHKIAELTIDSPPIDSAENGGESAPERLIHVRLLFGQTQIGVLAEDLSSGKVQNARVKFASY